MKRTITACGLLLALAACSSSGSTASPSTTRAQQSTTSATSHPTPAAAGITGEGTSDPGQNKDSNPIVNVQWTVLPDDFNIVTTFKRPFHGFLEIGLNADKKLATGCEGFDMFYSLANLSPNGANTRFINIASCSNLVDHVAATKATGQADNNRPLVAISIPRTDFDTGQTQIGLRVQARTSETSTKNESIAPSRTRLFAIRLR